MANLYALTNSKWFQRREMARNIELLQSGLTEDAEEEPPSPFQLLPTEIKMLILKYVVLDNKKVRDPAIFFINYRTRKDNIKKLWSLSRVNREFYAIFTSKYAYKYFAKPTCKVILTSVVKEQDENDERVQVYVYGGRHRRQYCRSMQIDEVSDFLSDVDVTNMRIKHSFPQQKIADVIRRIIINNNEKELDVEVISTTTRNLSEELTELRNSFKDLHIRSRHLDDAYLLFPRVPNFV